MCKWDRKQSSYIQLFPFRKQNRSRGLAYRCGVWSGHPKPQNLVTDVYLNVEQTTVEEFLFWKCVSTSYQDNNFLWNTDIDLTFLFLQCIGTFRKLHISIPFSSYLALKRSICLCKCLGYLIWFYLKKEFPFYLFFVWDDVFPSILIFFMHTGSVLPTLPTDKFSSQISSYSICSYLVIAFLSI